MVTKFLRDLDEIATSLEYVLNKIEDLETTLESLSTTLSDLSSEVNAVVDEVESFRFEWEQEKDRQVSLPFPEDTVGKDRGE